MAGLARVAWGGRGRVATVPVPVGHDAGGAVDADTRGQLVAGCEAPHFQGLRSLDQTGQLGLGHAGLALVHEVEDALHLPAADVFQHDDGVLAGVVHKDLLEVRGAGRKDHFVGPNCRVLAHDCAVNQGLILHKQTMLGNATT